MFILWRIWLFVSLLLLACGEKASISFVGVDKLHKEVSELFDIKVKVKFDKDTKNNYYHLILRHTKGDNEHYGGTVARKSVSKDGIVEFSNFYFDKACNSDCALEADLLVEPKDCRPMRSDGSCETSSYGSETKVSIPVTIAPTAWHMEATARKGASQIEISVSKDGQPATDVAAKIIACTNSGSSYRESDKKALYCSRWRSASSWMPSSYDMSLTSNNISFNRDNSIEDVFAYTPPNWRYDTFGQGVQEITFDSNGRWTGEARDYVDLKNICMTRVYVEVEKRALTGGVECPSEGGH